MITEYTCKGAADYEIGVNQNRNVRYHVSEPGGKADGVVLFIACFGIGFGYIDKWLEKASKKYNLIAVGVEYHCFKSRPETGALIQVTESLNNQLRMMCRDFGIAEHSDPSELSNEMLSEIGKKLDMPINLDGVLFFPPDGTYQNFGVVQALDHLYVIADMMDRKFPVDFSNIILFGSSHGGYIAHIISKLAPNTIRLIIDNSSYISAPQNYLGLGSEYQMFYNNLVLGCSTYSLWQHWNQYQDYYYNQHNRLIRDTCNADHLIETHDKTNRRTDIIAYNASDNDLISHPSDKKLQRECYSDYGINYELVLVGKSMLGDTFRAIEHGLGASLWNLFEDGMERSRKFKFTEGMTDFELGTILKFDCMTADISVVYGNVMPVEINLEKRRYN